MEQKPLVASASILPIVTDVTTNAQAQGCSHDDGDGNPDQDDETTTTMFAVNALPATSSLFLPPDILQTCLFNFCDAQSLSNFWCATSASVGQAEAYRKVLEGVLTERLNRRQRNISSEGIVQILMRLCRESVDETFAEREPSSSATSIPRSVIFRKLLALDFCDHSPNNMIWSGTFNFRSDVPLHFRKNTVDVVLNMTSQIWKMDDAHSWWSSYSSQIRSSLTVTTQPYNFIPIRPRGRLKGITRKDEESIRQIARHLEQYNLVGTLRAADLGSFRSFNGRPVGRRLIFRIISFKQARKRLEALYGRRRPVPQNEDTNAAREHSLPPALNAAFASLDADLLEGASSGSTSVEKEKEGMLVCCWESERPWEEQITAIEKLTALKGMLKNYKWLTTTEHKEIDA